MSDYDRTFNAEAKIKLTQLVNEGMTVLQEIEDLNAGLNDTIKAVADVVADRIQEALHHNEEE